MITFEFHCEQFFANEPKWQSPLKINLKESTFADATFSQNQMISQSAGKLKKVLPDEATEGIYEFKNSSRKYGQWMDKPGISYRRNISGWVIAENLEKASSLVDHYKGRYLES